MVRQKQVARSLTTYTQSQRTSKIRSPERNYLRLSSRATHRHRNTGHSNLETNINLLVRLKRAIRRQCIPSSRYHLLREGLTYNRTWPRSIQNWQQSSCSRKIIKLSTQKHPLHNLSLLEKLLLMLGRRRSSFPGLWGVTSLLEFESANSTQNNHNNTTK